MKLHALLAPNPSISGGRHRDALQTRRPCNLPTSSSAQGLGEPQGVWPPRSKPPEPPQRPALAPAADASPAKADLFTSDPLRAYAPVRAEQALDAAFGPLSRQRLYARSPEPRGLSPDHRRQLRFYGWTCAHLQALAEVGDAPKGERTVRWVLHKHAALHHFGFSARQVMELVRGPKTARERITNSLEILAQWFTADELIGMARYRGATLFISTLGDFMPTVLGRGYGAADVLGLLADGNGQRKLSAFARAPWPYPAYLPRAELLNILEQFIIRGRWREEGRG